MELRVIEVFWVTLAAFAGFEIALAANYLLLKLILVAMRAGVKK